MCVRHFFPIPIPAFRIEIHSSIRFYWVAAVKWAFECNVRMHAFLSCMCAITFIVVFLFFSIHYIYLSVIRSVGRSLGWSVGRSVGVCVWMCGCVYDMDACTVLNVCVCTHAYACVCLYGESSTFWFSAINYIGNDAMLLSNTVQMLADKQKLYSI